MNRSLLVAAVTVLLCASSRAEGPSVFGHFTWSMPITACQPTSATMGKYVTYTTEVAFASGIAGDLTFICPVPFEMFFKSGADNGELFLFGYPKGESVTANLYYEYVDSSTFLLHRQLVKSCSITAAGTALALCGSGHFGDLETDQYLGLNDYGTFFVQVVLHRDTATSSNNPAAAWVGIVQDGN